MEQRKPFEGITNIIRFNWHWYAIAFAVAAALLTARLFVSGYLKTVVLLLFALLVISTFLSLAVSFYVYDVSSLYSLNWLPALPASQELNLVTINAGFDETSYLIANHYAGAKLTVLDFYDAEKHTELSIARARKRYAVYSGTRSVTTSDVPLQKQSADYIFAILSVHEIRSRQERILFFQQLKKALKQEGKIIVTEHLRNLPNFVAYNFGFFHFFSKKEWKQTFTKAGLAVETEKTITPFIHVFFLQKHEHAL